MTDMLNIALPKGRLGEKVYNLLKAAGYACPAIEDPGQVRLDFSLGNDMKYYSGLVFKGYVRGVPSSVLSGGQYDRLLSHMGKKARAIGFAVYLDRLSAYSEGWDVDTLLLTGDAGPAQILAAAESLPGTVLAARTEPDDKVWKRKALWENGEVRYLD